MVKRIVAVIAVAAVLSGCAHVHRVDPTASKSDLEVLNRAVNGRRVSVDVMSGVRDRRGVTLPSESVRVAPDSTSLTLLLEPSEVSALWGEPSYGAQRDTTLSTLTIMRMTTRRRTRGALDGALLGLGLGVVLGALVGAAIDDPVPPEERAAFVGVFFGGAGAVVGLVAGAMMGSREVYDLSAR